MRPCHRREDGTREGERTESGREEEACRGVRLRKGKMVQQINTLAASTSMRI